MQLANLVGRLAIRINYTEHGQTNFMDDPVLVLSVTKHHARLLYLEGQYQGDCVTVNKEYFDDEWLDYGDVMLGATTTKATAITRILTILGIQADEDSLFNLCQALSYKQLLGELADGMQITDLLNLMGTRPQVANNSAQQVMGSLDKDSSWGNLVPNQNTPVNPIQNPFATGTPQGEPNGNTGNTAGSNGSAGEPATPAPFFGGVRRVR